MFWCTCFELFASCPVIHSRGACRCRSASARDGAEVWLVREQARLSRVETTIIASACEKLGNKGSLFFDRDNHNKTLTC